MAHQQMERDDMLGKHGGVRTKVAGDDEMLRTGFHNGTALEAGKIADSQPVDLFAPAPSPASSEQQRQQQEEDDDDGHGSSRVIAESEPVDLAASARGVAEANNNNNNNNPAPAPATATATVQGRQGMVAHVAGGRRLGRQA